MELLTDADSTGVTQSANLTGGTDDVESGSMVRARRAAPTSGRP